MPKSYTELYFPVLLQALIAMALAAGLLTVSYLLGKKVRNRVKDMPYESRHRAHRRRAPALQREVLPGGDAVHPVRYRSHFLYPWVVVYRELKMFGFVEMLIFVVLILSGFFYIWKKGALDWSGAGRVRAEVVTSRNATRKFERACRGRGGGRVRRRRRRRPANSTAAS